MYFQKEGGVEKKVQDWIKDDPLEQKERTIF